LSLLTLAGHSGAELAEKGENAMTDFALDWISGVFGSRAKKAVSRAHAMSWNKDPWTLGAFSSAPPGAQEARRALSEPLKDVVWFAGEAVHQTFSGTVGGAWQDGERAANAVIARLDHKPLRSAGGWQSPSRRNRSRLCARGIRRFVPRLQCAGGLTFKIDLMSAFGVKQTCRNIRYSPESRHRSANDAVDGTHSAASRSAPPTAQAVHLP